MNERGRDLENIIEQYLMTVKPMHYLYVEPTKKRGRYCHAAGAHAGRPSAQPRGLDGRGRGGGAHGGRPGARPLVGVIAGLGSLSCLLTAWRLRRAPSPGPTE